MEIDFKKLAKYSKPGPRYTSYPTANEFHKFTQDDLTQSLSNSDKNYSHIPFSLYTHMPFCKSACYFCGCNVIYTGKEERKQRYISYLQKELNLLKDHLNCKKEVVQFHFGGGTPTFFNASELEEVMKLIKNYFTNFSSLAEISCEIDPRYFNEDQMKTLHDYGFNRVSFGVQDFEPRVQDSINRIQPVSMVYDSVELARKYGINSINFDLIYGLPFQSVASFLSTLEKVIQLNPDRLAIFNYAHVPWVKKTMRKIDEHSLPSPEVKLEILKETIQFLESNNYEMIGMDHFAKKNDDLCISKNKGILRRNFQGYTAKGFSQTIGIGLTSIGEGVDYYTQNFKDMASYESCLDKNILPVHLGKKLNSEDILRKRVIMDLMNNSLLDFKSINKEFNIDFKEYFHDEILNLRSLQDLEFLEISENNIIVNKMGSLLIRNIAMVFDQYLLANKTTQFSKTI